MELNDFLCSLYFVANLITSAWCVIIIIRTNEKHFFAWYPFQSWPIVYGMSVLALISVQGINKSGHAKCQSLDARQRTDNFTRNEKAMLSSWFYYMSDGSLWCSCQVRSRRSNHVRGSRRRGCTSDHRIHPWTNREPYAYDPYKFASRSLKSIFHYCKGSSRTHTFAY